MTRYLKIRERERWIVLRGGSFTQFCFSSVSSFSSLPFAGTWRGVILDNSFSRRSITLNGWNWKLFYIYGKKTLATECRGNADAFRMLGFVGNVIHQRVRKNWNGVLFESALSEQIDPVRLLNGENVTGNRELQEIERV